MKITCSEIEIDFFKRIGYKQANKIRPVLVGLSTWSKKIKILKAGAKLKQLNMYVTEDFPKGIIEERKGLIPIMIQKRKEGHHAIIKYNKLFVDHKEHTTNKRDSEEEDLNRTITSDETKRKRLEPSPQDVRQQSKKQNVDKHNTPKKFLRQTNNMKKYLTNTSSDECSDTQPEPDLNLKRTNSL